MFSFKRIDAVKISAIVVLTVLAAAILAVILNSRALHNQYQAANPELITGVRGDHKKFIIPTGKQVYRISQAAETWPKIIQATIDPVDVHVGDNQFLSVIVEDDVDIVLVEARIETDNGGVTIPLKYSEPAKVLWIPSVEIARAAELTKTLLYKGEWRVKDTHDTTYHTVFVAKDALGRESSVTLAWSDACGIPFGGDATLSSNCSIAAADGVDNGNLTINAGVTLTLSAAFGFNPGKTITVNGAIALGENGLLQKNNIWMVDADNDAYPGSVSQYIQSAAPAGGRRRYLLNSSGIDCNDASASIYPGTVTTGSCSCNYSSTCDDSSSGTTTTSTCTAGGTFSGGTGSCSCSRDTDGDYCGTTYGCSFCNRTQITKVCAGGSCSGTGSETSLGCSTACCDCCSDSDCGSGSVCSWIFICVNCSGYGNACGGGTPCNSCSSSQPWYCSCSGYSSDCSGYSTRSSVQDCGGCGCPSGETCQAGGTCL